MAIDWDNAERLYDREQQQDALFKAYNRNKAQQEEVPASILITGHSGSGKTALAETLKPQVAADGGYFVTGKFDQGKCTSLHASASPCFEAFRGLALRAKELGEEETKRITREIEETLGQDRDILMEIIPDLGLLWGEEVCSEGDLDSSSEHSFSTRRVVEIYDDNRGVILSMYRRFLRAVATPKTPLVLLVDDLQWADKWSLSLVELAAELSCDGFLLLLTCRNYSNEGPVSQFLTSLGGLQEISVANWSLNALTEMISDKLDRPLEQCLEVAQTVFARTNGNPFFSCQYLKQLQEKESLQSTGKEADLREGVVPAKPLSSLERQQSNLDRHLLELLGSKMQDLSPEAVEVLKVASCLGGKFDQQLLEAITGQPVEGLLLAAQQKGLICYDPIQQSGTFIHDRMQEAAYALIPTEERPEFHLSLGRRLRNGLPLELLRRNVATILSQIQLGLDLVQDPAEREQMAHLALKVSRKACKTSSFALAYEMAELGLKLLQPRVHWRDQYELTLNMYSGAIDASYCCGKHERLDELTSEVFQYARSFHDTFQAHNAKILSYHVQYKTMEGIEHCRGVLKKLGEPFPRKASGPRVLWELFETKRLLSRLSDDDIMNLPTLTDPTISAKMTFIHQLFPLKQAEHFEYSPLLCFRLIKLALEHGLGAPSACAFATYGAVIGRTGKSEVGYRYVKLAFRILERFPSDVWMGRCLVAALTGISSARENLRDGLAPLMTAHRLALKSGDYEIAFVSAFWHCMVRMLIGDPLPTIQRRLVSLYQLASDCGQTMAMEQCSLVHQWALDLIGKRKDDATSRILGACDEQSLWKRYRSEGRTMFLSLWFHFKACGASFCKNYDMVEPYIQKANKLTPPLAPATAVPYLEDVCNFHLGLAAAEQARHGRRRKLRVVRRQRRKLQAQALRCPANYLHKTYLLDAEILAVQGKLDQAVCAYEQSIAYANKAQFVSEEALANEKAALALAGGGKEARAVPFLVQARDLYEKWGAEAKSSEMDELIARLSFVGMNARSNEM